VLKISDPFMPQTRDKTTSSTILVGEIAEVFHKWFVATEPSLLLSSSI